MSAPAPRTVNTPPDPEAEPALPTWPMSSFRQPAGKPDASDTLTRSKAAVASVVLSWLVTASPARTGPLIASVCSPVLVQLTPSAETNAVIFAPALVSFTNRGAVPETELLVDTAPAAVRPWNAIPFAGVTKSDACAERASALCRIMTPALVHALTFWTCATRATIAPSPFNGR